MTLSAAARSRSVRRPSAPVRSIALTSMCEASHGASSDRWPVSRLTMPPGRSLVASASASSIAASGLRLRGDRDDRVAADERRRDPRDEPEQRRLLRRDDGDDAGRLRHGEVEVRPGHGVRTAEHLRQLVGEPGVPDPTVDRALDLVPPRRQLGELGNPRLHHLGDPVEHLAAVVRGRRSPLRLRGARRRHGIARVLARGPRDVLALSLVDASRLRARERAADEELVGLLDRQPGHAAEDTASGITTRETGSSVLELERHEDVVDVDAVQQELLLAARLRRRTRPTRTAASRPRSRRAPEVSDAARRGGAPRRRPPRSGPPHPAPLPRRVDGDPVDLQHVARRRERRDRLEPHVAGDLALVERDDDILGARPVVEERPALSRRRSRAR